MAFFSELGELASKAYKAYDQYAYGGMLPGGYVAAANQPLYQAPVITGAPQTGANTPASDIPATVYSGGSMADGATCGTGCDAPRYLTYDCKTGEFKKKRRRRRKAMLTLGDRDTLNFIASLPNNANVKSALANRIGRG